MEKRTVIIGGGQAASQCAFALRKNGYVGDISLISKEPYLPYHRPPLSKEYLKGEKTINELFIRDENAYAQSAIHVSLGRAVMAVDRKEQYVLLEDNTKMIYDKLVMAVGGTARKLNIAGSDLKNVFYIRTIQHINTLKTALSNKSKVVIIGGGYIAIETASVLRRLGAEVRIVEMAERILNRVTSKEVSDFITDVHAENGVRIECNKNVIAFEGKEHIEQVCCDDGTKYDADIVIVAVGLVPNITLAKKIRLEISNGIVADSSGKTSDEHIYAAGDCANFYHEAYQKNIRLESVPNAIEQANVVAANICKKPVRYTAQPWFWTEFYDIKMQIVGLNMGYNEVVIRGDMEHSRKFSIWYLNGERIVAVDSVNNPFDFMIAKQVLAHNIGISKKDLSDMAVNLKSYIKK